MKTKSSITGFTLIEIAIVLLIVTILLGYTVAMFPVQQELRQYREANSEMNSIITQLVGFAQINGRLPCPDTNALPGTVDGMEDISGNGCAAYFGYLPSGTLGIDGRYDTTTIGRLLDPWGQPYRYAVSDADFSTDGDYDFVFQNGIRNEGIANVTADLSICDDSPNATANQTGCIAAGGNDVVSGVVAVVISTGKDRNQIISNVQSENTDNFDDGTQDKVYVSKARSEASGREYDDVVKWLSLNQLISKMIEADQLP